MVYNKLLLAEPKWFNTQPAFKHGLRSTPKFWVQFAFLFG